MMLNGKSVVIVGRFRYPYGDAASARVTMLGRALQSEGARVFIVTSNNNSSDLPPHGTREGIPYECVMASTKDFGRIGNAVYRFIFTAQDLSARLSDFYPSNGPDFLIVYGSSSILAGEFLKWAKLRNTKVVLDVVEWYDPHQCVGGYFGPFWYDCEHFMRYASRRAHGVIAISRWLEDYYRGLKMPTVRIPGLVNSDGLDSEASGGNLREPMIIYTGFPGKKDLLGPIVDAAEILQKNGLIEARFVLAGRGVEDALRIQGVSARRLAALKNLSLVGWLPEEELVNLRRSASAMVVLRSPGRSSLANFPQKFAEGLAFGCPILVNEVGDMANYVRDGVNGYRLREPLGPSLAETVERLIRDPAQITAMSNSAIQTARLNFGHKAVAKSLGQFLSTL